MIYLLYLLLLLTTFVVTYSVTLFIVDRDTLKNLFKSAKKGLKHKELLTLLDYFEYVPDDGVCFGFTLTWAQEVALETDQCFYQRLNLIKQDKHHILKKINAVNYKIRQREGITTQEDQLLEIKPFFEAICLAQSPEDYGEIYAKRLNQTNIDTILSLIRHKLANDSTVKRFFAKTLAFHSKRSVVDYFKQLSQLLIIQDKIAMVLCCENHAVGLKKYADGWLFIDINYLYEQTEDYPFLILDNEGLATQLYESFEENKEIIFNTDFIAANPSAELKKRLCQLHDLYPVFRKQIAYSNSRQIGFLTIGAQNGEEKTVREIVRLHNQYDHLNAEQISRAVYYAIINNQKSVLNLLLRAHGFNINMSCRNDGSNPLAVACDFGYLELVKLLLSFANIQVNAVNQKGLTPLMLACQSQHTFNNPDLFIVLLQAKASLKLKNLQGEDALAIAEKNGNTAAISIIRKFSMTKPLTIYSPGKRQSMMPHFSSTDSYSLFAPKEKKNTKINGFCDAIYRPDTREIPSL